MTQLVHPSFLHPSCVPWHPLPDMCLFPLCQDQLMMPQLAMQARHENHTIVTHREDPLKDEKAKRHAQLIACLGVSPIPKPSDENPLMALPEERPGPQVKLPRTSEPWQAEALARPVPKPPDQVKGALASMFDQLSRNPPQSRRKGGKRTLSPSQPSQQTLNNNMTYARHRQKTSAVRIL